MTIESAQRDVRTVYRNGALGQAIAGVLWLASAALSTWAGHRPGFLLLAVGGALIFPLTTLALALLGGPAHLPKGHPMNALGTQAGLVAALALPLVGAAALRHPAWFYPAFMVAIGAHYLPFAFLYGMWEFALLAYVLVAGGTTIGLWWPDDFTLGGWVTGALLLAFAAGVTVTRGRGDRGRAD